MFINWFFKFFNKDLKEASVLLKKLINLIILVDSWNVVCNAIHAPDHADYYFC